MVNHIITTLISVITCLVVWYAASHAQKELTEVETAAKCATTHQFELHGHKVICYLATQVEDDRSK